MDQRNQPPDPLACIPPWLATRLTPHDALTLATLIVTRVIDPATLAPPPTLPIPQPLPQHLPQTWLHWYAATTALRPDLAITTPRGTILLELKPTLTPHALGQALAYHHLATSTRTPPDYAATAIACLYAPPWLRSLAASLGISVLTPPTNHRTHSSTASAQSPQPS